MEATKIGPGGATTYMIHHIFLPPKLPQSAEENGAAHDLDILLALEGALREFRLHLDCAHRHILDSVRSMISNARQVQDRQGQIQVTELQECFQELSSNGGAVPVHIQAQNVALLAYKDGSSIIFEAYELSLQNREVMSTKGRVGRWFLGQGVAVEQDAFADNDFQSALAKTVATMSRQPVAEMIPKARKSGQKHFEDRDTVNPMLVTTYLMGVLEAMGTPRTTPRIWKNTRDEVLWSDAARPWRRSPVWLLIRVAMQATFSRHAADSGGLYKAFLIFFQATILDRARKQQVSNDLLHCMAAKILRRLRKVGRVGWVGKAWYPFVGGILDKTIELLESRRSQFGRAIVQDMQLSGLPSLRFAHDTGLSLPCLDDFVSQVGSGTVTASTREFVPVPLTARYRLDVLPSLERRGTRVLYRLAGVEAWVAAGLDKWFAANVTTKSTCKALFNLLETYHLIASDKYLGNPENTSLKLLTAMELWVACDKSATLALPLLSDYDPQIPQQLLQSLILPLEDHMRRLERVERYLDARRSRASNSFGSIFRDFGTKRCFAVRYFASSKDHQDLLARIEEKAHKEREKKKQELARLKAKYRQLMSLHATESCEYYTVRRRRHDETIHRGDCSRCAHKASAESLKISIHEWPLPSDKRHAEATVFELAVPEPFNDWRDATTYLILDVLQSKYAQEESPKHRYPPSYCLSGFTESPARIRLLSEVKPHAATHRKTKEIEYVTESDVCVSNGLQCHYYDAKVDSFVSKLKDTDIVAMACTYPLSDPSSSIKDFIFRLPSTPSTPRGMTPNDVLARQCNCPDDISLEEFKALASLPIGYRVQWSNILRQLFIPSVDFKKADTGTVLLQVSRQAGPPSQENAHREGHQDLRDSTFASELLRGLVKGLARTKENWESSQALSSFVLLASRLLSLNPNQEISARCLEFLSGCRDTALGWTRLLMDKAQQSSDDERLEFLQKASEIAQVCSSTFDIDQDRLPELLAQPSEAAKLIECSIIVQETACAARADEATESSLRKRPLQRICIQRWIRLMHTCFPTLLAEIVDRGNPCLDDAVARSWSAYRPSGGWKPCPGGAEHWLVTQTSSVNGRSLPVQFNLLTAELLVNGLPLARLPAEYERNPRYSTLFGTATVEVMPSSMAGMQFSAKRPLHGFNLFLNLDAQTNDLQVVATKGDQRYDLVPQRVFGEVLPHHFVRDYVHWYHSGTGTVHLRPAADPWPIDQPEWRIAAAQGSWTLSRGDSSIISVESATANTLAQLLSPLESARYIHMVYSSSRKTLEIELPRLRLMFYLDEGSCKIHSREFRGLYVDKHQHIGALVGLVSKLVLRDDKGSRAVLIPNGKPTWKSYDEYGHTWVSIPHGLSDRTYSYHIDDRIGRLLDDSTLQSKLSLARLHALTALCLPDELTRKTGTEQALGILDSADVRSFGYLTSENMDTLRAIAMLAPPREYYPRHLEDMQQVYWDSRLGFLAQDGRFYKLVQAIFDQALSSKFFYPDSPDLPDDWKKTNAFLLKRDLLRTSFCRLAGFGAEEHTAVHDKAYRGRYGDDEASRQERSFVAASAICHSIKANAQGVKDNLAETLYDFLSSPQTKLQDPGVPLTTPIQYDGEQLLSQPKAYLGRHWCQIHRAFRSDSSLGKYDIMMFVAALAFAKEELKVGPAVQVLTALANVSTVRDINIPQFDTFRLWEGRRIDAQVLRTTVSGSLKSFHQCPEYNWERYDRESWGEFDRRREGAFEENQEDAVQDFVTDLVLQWPLEVPETPRGNRYSTYIDVPSAMGQVRPKFLSWYRNREFFKYLTSLKEAMRLGVPVEPIPGPAQRFHLPPPTAVRRRAFVVVDDLFHGDAPPVPVETPGGLDELLMTTNRPESAEFKLFAMLRRAEDMAAMQHERNYVMDMWKSLAYFLRDITAGSMRQPALAAREFRTARLEQYQRSCTDHLEALYGELVRAVHRNAERLPSHSAVMELVGSEKVSTYQIPKVSPRLFLQQLARDRWPRLSPEWQRAIVAYGLALTKAQQADRLVSLCDNEVDLVKELQNPGHANWDPHLYPESLLIEIESGFMIRGVQEEIAARMRSPPDGANSVMQLNMGEGKSSVIVPIVSAALANGSQLVRVVVAKPQSKQMLEMILSKLGGLCNRRIYHMPFSRSLKLSKDDAVAIGAMYRECMDNGGILLVQPEHILSFKLMGVECLASGRNEIGRILLDTQHFFDTKSRDIVDESDENFSVKFELIYTMGAQKPIELSPDRWILIQQLLGMIPGIMNKIRERHPLSVQIGQLHHGQFPRTRILHKCAEELLAEELAGQICSRGLPAIARQPEDVRQAVLTYITKRVLSDEEIDAVEGNCSFWTESTRGPLLLVRGLIAGKVLGFVFREKRWRVNYGLDPTRLPKTQLALPFRAKDSPAPRSEFSHPDVVIILTCLCYYYGGLTDEQLFLAFAHLLKSDKADTEYGEWIKQAPNMPDAFRRLMGVNIKDRFQCVHDVFPHLRKAKPVVDYFLSCIVFTKEMREFPQKLSASGWDIGQAKKLPTTGFSGTNDSQHLLPLAVNHLDLPEQRHTNALVIENLLRDENTIELFRPSESATSDADSLLRAVTAMNPPVQVLLDVGAQILELRNEEVAEAWLQITESDAGKDAVVFFDDGHELSVRDRGGRVEPLQTSPFAKQLDRCLVFLDEAHTRGTDLKLPEHYRAAVTLGANLTKDRLVQACMRMRKLGKGQSVVFCIPEEIENKILEVTRMTDASAITVGDVIIWSIMHETLSDLRKSMPLWAIQGVRFERQKAIWEEVCGPDGISMSPEQARRFLEDESQSLEFRYSPRAGVQELLDTEGIPEGNTALQAISKRCREFDCLQMASATLQEEQERELAPEMEQERQVERPPAAKPMVHYLHPDVEAFARSGRVSLNSPAFLPAFQDLAMTTAAEDFGGIEEFSREVLITEDFSQTVQEPDVLTKGWSDSYRRAVQFILTSTHGGTGANAGTVSHMVIISPFEANELMPILSRSNSTGTHPAVTLHIYAPRTSLAFDTLDHLRLRTVPTLPPGWTLPRGFIVPLNVFSGQLYFDSFTEYTEACDFFGLAWQQPPPEGMVVEADGFIARGGTQDGGGAGPRFSKSPVKFIRTLLSNIRRDRESIDKTHWGRVLSAAFLGLEDFEGGDVGVEEGENGEDGTADSGAEADAPEDEDADSNAEAEPGEDEDEYEEGEIKDEDEEEDGGEEEGGCGAVADDAGMANLFGEVALHDNHMDIDPPWF